VIWGIVSDPETPKPKKIHEPDKNQDGAL
jgi:hypothetical protein